jgi:hypothetical protein
MMMLRVPLRAPRAATVLMPLYFIAYLVDDALPTGPFAYHLAVRARGNKPTDAPAGHERLEGIRS